ncbi:unnamed protein product [Rotaria sp. Silwood1]|nr:unnamed protein product [Rotaria sp. Silwood1]CAF1632409.1 unnamed protein product [Rotaria sp. Silwood1]
MDKLSKSVEVLKLLSTTTSQTLIINVEKLFTKCDENDYDVRLTAEENLNHLNLKEVDLTRIQVELHGVITHNPNVGPTALKDQLLEHQNQNASTHLIKRIIQLLRYSNLFDFDQLLI